MSAGQKSCACFNKNFLQKALPSLVITRKFTEDTDNFHFLTVTF